MKNGDRVQGRGTSPTEDDYDVGTVVAVLSSGMVMVAWDVAGETYKEDPAELELIKETT